MENKKTIKLLFENELNLEMVSNIIDRDMAFLYSILKLAGCKNCPEMINVKLGIVHKEE